MIVCAFALESIDRNWKWVQKIIRDIDWLLSFNSMIIIWLSIVVSGGHTIAKANIIIIWFCLCAQCEPSSIVILVASINHLVLLRQSALYELQLNEVASILFGSILLNFHNRFQNSIKTIWKVKERARSVCLRMCWHSPRSPNTQCIRFIQPSNAKACTHIIHHATSTGNSDGDDGDGATNHQPYLINTMRKSFWRRKKRNRRLHSNKMNIFQTILHCHEKVLGTSKKCALSPDNSGRTNQLKVYAKLVPFSRVPNFGS